MSKISILYQFGKFWIIKNIRLTTFECRNRYWSLISEFNIGIGNPTYTKPFLKNHISRNRPQTFGHDCKLLFPSFYRICHQAMFSRRILVKRRRHRNHGSFLDQFYRMFHIRRSTSVEKLLQWQLTYVFNDVDVRRKKRKRQILFL